MKLYLVECKGPVEGRETTTAYLAMANKPHVAAASATKSFDENGGAVEGLRVVELTEEGATVALLGDALVLAAACPEPSKN